MSVWVGTTAQVGGGGGGGGVAVTNTYLLVGTVGLSYYVELAATGGTPPYTYSATGLPAGMSLSTDGAITFIKGPPSGAGVSNVSITATDSTSTVSPAVVLPLAVNATDPSALNVKSTTLSVASVGGVYNGSLLAYNSARTWPYTFSVTGVPAWMTMRTDGTFTGTPPNTTPVVLTVTATDSSTPAIVSAPTYVVLPVVPSVGTWFGAQLPNYPKQFTTTCSPPTPANTNRGSYYTPGVGADASMTLQTAINNAGAATGSKGDVIVLQAGTTYVTGTNGLSLASRAGTGWIYIISSQAPEIGGSGLPAAGTRVTRANIPNMASIRPAQSNTAILTKGTNQGGVSYYRFVGLDMQLIPDYYTTYYILNFNGQDYSLDTLAKHITIDRCYCAGGPNGGCIHGIGLDGMYMEVTESVVERCWGGTAVGNADTQAILMLNSTGPYKIHNCWLEAGGQTVFAGGGDPNLPQPSNPGDITITNNVMYKPRAYMTANYTSGSNVMTVTAITSGEIVPSMNVWPGSTSVFPPITTSNPMTYIFSQLTSTEPGGALRGRGTYQLSGTVPIATVTGDNGQCVIWNAGKNTFEMKTVARQLVDSNYFMHAFAGVQQRTAYGCTVRNQGGLNWANRMEDVICTNNVFSDCFNGLFTYMTQDSYSYASACQPGYRYLFRNNVAILSRMSGSPSATSDQSVWQISANLPPANANQGYGGHIVFDHNTYAAPLGPTSMYTLFWISTQTTNKCQMNNMVWSNNIWDAQQGGIGQGGGGGSWNASVLPQCTQPAWAANATVNFYDSTLPSNNNPATPAAVGFVNYGSTIDHTGYKLTAGSTYHGVGVSGAGQAYNSAGTSDGTDLGPDFTKLPITPSEPSAAAPKLVQSNNVHVVTASSSIPLAFTTNVTGGSCLFAFFGGYDTTVVPVLSDNLNSGNWTQVAHSNQTIYGSLWVRPNTAAGACTVTFASTPAMNGWITIGEISGVSASPVDQANLNAPHDQPSNAPTVSTAAATTKPIEAVVVGVIQNVVNDWSAGPGTQVSATGSQPYGVFFYTTNTTGVQSWTRLGGGAAGIYIATIVTLSP